MASMKRQSDVVQYVVRAVQRQADLSSCLSSGCTTEKTMERVQRAMAVVQRVEPDTWPVTSFEDEDEDKKYE